MVFFSFIDDTLATPKAFTTLAFSNSSISDNLQNLGYIPESGDVFPTFPARAFRVYNSLKIPLYEEDGTTLRQRTENIDFKLDFFKKRDGSDYVVTLEKDDPIDVVKDVPLEDLYFPITYKPSFYDDRILGTLEQSLDGKIYIPNQFIVGGSINRQISVESYKFDLPEIKLLLEKEVFDEANYGTESIKRNINELLINVDSFNKDYFYKIANLPEVKNLAKKYGVTIRFKVNNLENEKILVKKQHGFNNRASEIFFLNVKDLYSFNTNDLVVPF